MKYFGTVKLHTPKMAKNSPNKPILGFESWKEKNRHEQQATDCHSQITYINKVLDLFQNPRYLKLDKNSPKWPFLCFFQSLEFRKSLKLHEISWHAQITYSTNVSALSQNFGYPKMAKNSPKWPILGYFESLKEKNRLAQ